MGCFSLRDDLVKIRSEPYGLVAPTSWRLALPKHPLAGLLALVVETVGARVESALGLDVQQIGGQLVIGGSLVLEDRVTTDGDDLRLQLRGGRVALRLNPSQLAASAGRRRR
jgi:hypothetical protein